MALEQKRPRSVGTHNGTFHADEVTACGLLSLFDLIDIDKIVRTRDMAILGSCEYVCDVGGVYDPARKLFDHHQAEYQGQWSSAGMVLDYLKKIGTIDHDAYEFFCDALIRGVDDHDNGRANQVAGSCTFSHVVANFTPIRYDVSEEEQDRAFKEAFQFVHGHLDRMWRRYCYNRDCRQIVADCMATSSECLIFDRAIPWLESFFALNGQQHPAVFVIMPSGKHWKLRGIPPSYEDRMAVRVPLPAQWAGLLDKELGIVSGIPGGVFCHKGRFISVWETKEDALKALEYTLRQARTAHDDARH